MKRAFASLLLFIAVQPLFAQNSDAVIKGTVYNQQGEAVTNASVAVYTDSSQSDILTGTTSNTTGAFVIDAEPGDYVLGVSFISYSTHTEPIELNSGETENVGEIILAPTSEQMGEVTVRAEESHMEMSIDLGLNRLHSDTLFLSV